MASNSQGAGNNISNLNIIGQSAAKFDQRQANSFYRAPWTLQTAIGDGFDRTTCAYTRNGVTGTEIPLYADGLESKKITMHKSVSETSSDYAEAYAGSASVAFSGWGQSVSASVSAATQRSHSHRAVTALLAFEFLTDPHFAYHPTQPSSDVILRPEAKELLACEGPSVFHQVYGTHFVTGYTTGGCLRGHYSAYYHTASQATQASASINASLSYFGTKASASVSFESDVSKTTGFRNQELEYSAVGWGGKLPPPAKFSMEDLLNSVEGFDMSAGRRLEAILGSYEDVKDYREAVKAFHDAGGIDNYTPLDVRSQLSMGQMELFERIGQVLNHEVLSMEFVLQRLHDTREWNNIPSWRNEAANIVDEAARRLFRIKEAFGRSDDSLANWRYMMAYSRWYQGATREERKQGPPDDEKHADARTGYDLAATFFDNDALVHRMERHINYRIRYRFNIAVDWISSGADGGPEAEVKGSIKIWWLDGAEGRKGSQTYAIKRNVQPKYTKFTRPVRLFSIERYVPHALESIEVSLIEDDSQEDKKDETFPVMTLKPHYGTPVNLYQQYDGPAITVTKELPGGFCFKAILTVEPVILYLS